MADRIAVMSHGGVVQIGSPQDIYDRPSAMHVAGFVGSPPMNFLKFKSCIAPGQDSVRLNGETIRVPTLEETTSTTTAKLITTTMTTTTITTTAVRRRVAGIATRRSPRVRGSC